MAPTSTEQVLELVRKAGVFRPRDLDSHGIPREYLVRLCRKGLVQRVGRGLYTLADADVSEHHSLAEASKKIPHGVICLLSALRFHGLTTQAPFEVWVAVDVKARKPKSDGLPLRIVRFSGAALHSGVEDKLIKGVKVKDYSAAETVADCFKYRLTHPLGQFPSRRASASYFVLINPPFPSRPSTSYALCRGAINPHPATNQRP